MEILLLSFQVYSGFPDISAFDPGHFLTSSPGVHYLEVDRDKN